MIYEQVGKLKHFVKLMQSGESASNDAIDAMQAAIKDAAEAMKGSFSAWSLGLKKSCESLCGEVQLSGMRSASAVEKTIKTMSVMLENVVCEAREHIEKERNAAVELGTLVKDNANTEVGI